jgi:hypothetical protein
VYYQFEDCPTPESCFWRQGGPEDRKLEWVVASGEQVG